MLVKVNTESRTGRTFSFLAQGNWKCWVSPVGCEVGDAETVLGFGMYNTGISDSYIPVIVFFNLIIIPSIKCEGIFYCPQVGLASIYECTLTFIDRASLSTECQHGYKLKS